MDTDAARLLGSLLSRWVAVPTGVRDVLVFSIYDGESGIMVVVLSLCSMISGRVARQR